MSAQEIFQNRTGNSSGKPSHSLTHGANAPQDAPRWEFEGCCLAWQTFAQNGEWRASDPKFFQNHHVYHKNSVQVAVSVLRRIFRQQFSLCNLWICIGPIMSTGPHSAARTWIRFDAGLKKFKSLVGFLQQVSSWARHPSKVEESTSNIMVTNTLPTQIDKELGWSQSESTLPKACFKIIRV